MTWRESIESLVCKYHAKERSINQRAITRNCVGCCKAQGQGPGHPLASMNSEPTPGLGHTRCVLNKCPAALASQAKNMLVILWCKEKGQVDVSWERLGETLKGLWSESKVHIGYICQNYKGSKWQKPNSRLLKKKGRFLVSDDWITQKAGKGAGLRNTWNQQLCPFRSLSSASQVFSASTLISLTFFLHVVGGG